MKKLIKISILNLGLFLFPIQVLAHEEEASISRNEVNFWVYGLIGALLVLVVFTTLIFINKI